MHLNEPAPDFQLSDLQGKCHKLRDYLGKIVIINFWSAECPHSERADRSLLDLLEKHKGQMVLLSIAANRNESLELVEEIAERRGIPVVLLDTNDVVADLYDAIATPHVFVVDREGVLRYCGAVDDVTFRQRTATRFFVGEAVDALLEGRQLVWNETAAYGCAIVREI